MVTLSWPDKAHEDAEAQLSPRNTTCSILPPPEEKQVTFIAIIHSRCFHL